MTRLARLIPRITSALGHAMQDIAHRTGSSDMQTLGGTDRDRVRSAVCKLWRGAGVLLGLCGEAAGEE